MRWIYQGSVRMFSRLFLLLSLLAAPAFGADFDLAFYYGYWGEVPQGVPRVEFYMPNYYLISEGKTPPDAGTKFEADSVPLVSSAEVQGFSILPVTRMPQGWAVVSVEIAEAARERIGKEYVEWAKDADPRRNILLVNRGRVLGVLEIGQIWMSGRSLLMSIGSRSEAAKIEQAIQKGRPRPS
ncbi:hypothetical protein RQP53_07440 [Paucibacter sp. APW11]|uniref:DUF4136 domain-containing protein n=1 Tax=Roseateles aquae TaxID=3077235 RepID=A0ABU3P9Z2_9BURK|nr:hypothetical protein [Paucibacter sp. APW11]MDT8999097.1 hypothetical protein [Paucibacter sp. APW11]